MTYSLTKILANGECEAVVGDETHRQEGSSPFQTDRISQAWHEREFVLMQQPDLLGVVIEGDKS